MGTKANKKKTLDHLLSARAIGDTAEMEYQAIQGLQEDKLNKAFIDGWHIWQMFSTPDGSMFILEREKRGT